MNYKITHNTHYSYNNFVNLCYNEARLTPRSFTRQVCNHSKLIVEPDPSGYRERKDFFGNTVCFFSIQRPHQELSVIVTSEVEVYASNFQLDLVNGFEWEDVHDQLHIDVNEEILEMRQYILESPMIPELPELRTYAKTSFTPDRSLLESVAELTERLYTEFEYDTNFTSVATPLKEVMEHRRGVCQDFAHLGIGCVRSMGLAARYVSGYIETVTDSDQEQLVGSGASHAWFSVYFPEIGWIDFDPTNNVMPTDRHITVAWGRDYSDVTPLKGVVYGSGTHELSVSVDCRSI